MGTLSLFWPKVPGSIVYFSPEQGFRKYQVDVRYKYAYQGSEYRGNLYRFQFVFNRVRIRNWLVDSIQARYPVGESVQVAVNPWNPSESVLEPGPELDSLLAVAVGLLLMLAGLADARKERPKQPRRSKTATALVVIGSLVLLYGLPTLCRGWSSLNWPTADGKVLSSTARSTGRNHLTLLWYEYYVQQTRYVGSEYRVGGNGTPFKDVAVAAAARYPVGRSVNRTRHPGNRVGRQKVHRRRDRPSLTCILWYLSCNRID
jgi:hypothetical protein